MALPSGCAPGGCWFCSSAVRTIRPRLQPMQPVVRRSAPPSWPRQNNTRLPSASWAMMLVIVCDSLFRRPLHERLALAAASGRQPTNRRPSRKDLLRGWSSSSRRDWGRECRPRSPRARCTRWLTTGLHHLVEVAVQVVPEQVFREENGRCTRFPRFPSARSPAPPA